jgi:hypothetical protein
VSARRLFLSHVRQDEALALEVGRRLGVAHHAAPSLGDASHVIAFASATYLADARAQRELRAAAELRREFGAPTIVVVSRVGAQPAIGAQGVPWGTAEEIADSLRWIVAASDEQRAEAATAWRSLAPSAARKALQFVLDRAPRARSAAADELRLTVEIEPRLSLEITVSRLLAADPGFVAELRAELRLAELHQRAVASLRADIAQEAPSIARTQLMLAAEDTREKLEQTWQKIYEAAESLCPLVVEVRAPTPAPSIVTETRTHDGRAVPAVTPPAALARLLADLFDEGEFLRFLRGHPGTAMIHHGLGRAQGIAGLTADAVELLLRHGRLDTAFFAALLAERERRRRDIEPVAAAVLAWVTARTTTPA